MLNFLGIAHSFGAFVFWPIWVGSQSLWSMWKGPDEDMRSMHHNVIPPTFHTPQIHPFSTPWLTGHHGKSLHQIGEKDCSWQNCDATFKPGVNGLAILSVRFVVWVRHLITYFFYAMLLESCGALWDRCLGTDSCRNNLWQFYSWCYVFLPDGARFFTFGLAAICWAIWNYRNHATFEFKMPKSPSEIVFSACVLHELLG